MAAEVNKLRKPRGFLKLLREGFSLQGVGEIELVTFKPVTSFNPAWRRQWLGRSLRRFADGLAWILADEAALRPALDCLFEVRRDRILRSTFLELNNTGSDCHGPGRGTVAWLSALVTVRQLRVG